MLFLNHIEAWKKEAGGGREYNALQMVEHGIKSEPTAYDAEKVCRKLSEAKDIDNLIDYDHAVRIVKSGGVDGE